VNQVYGMVCMSMGQHYTFDVSVKQTLINQSISHFAQHFRLTSKQIHTSCVNAIFLFVDQLINDKHILVL
jgi:hypothetical protein